MKDIEDEYQIFINDLWFKKELIKILETNNREDAYQTYIVYQMLQSVLDRLEKRKRFMEYEVIDTHMFKQRNSESHDRSFYSSLALAVPDLIIAKDFYFNNRDKDLAKYEISIEIKAINSKEMLGKSFDDSNLFDVELLSQILPQLLKKQAVILTNLRVWYFIELKSETEIVKNNSYKTIIDFFDIIEKCGIDNYSFNREQHLKDLGSCSYLQQSSDGKLKSDYDKLKNVKEIKEYIKIVDGIVKSVIKTNESSINAFFNECCKKETFRLLNDKRFVSEYGAKRQLEVNEYISGVADICFYNDSSICELMRKIENFISLHIK